MSPATQQDLFTFLLDTVTHSFVSAAGQGVDCNLLWRTASDEHVMWTTLPGVHGHHIVLVNDHHLATYSDPLSKLGGRADNGCEYHVQPWGGKLLSPLADASGEEVSEKDLPKNFRYVTEDDIQYFSQIASTLTQQVFIRPPAQKREWYATA